MKTNEKNWPKPTIIQNSYQLIQERIATLNVAQELAISDENMSNWDDNFKMLIKVSNEKDVLYRLSSEMLRAGVC